MSAVATEISNTETRERPIIFSGEMVRATLDDRKWQTRRVVKPQPDRPLTKNAAGHWRGSDRAGIDPSSPTWKCPYGQPGDKLWVRESFKADYLPRSVIEDSDLPPLARDHFRATIDYRASQGEPMTRDVHMEHWRVWLEDGWKKWKPSIHMPRWASRITLEITGIRVERLKKIGVNDAKAEGVEPLGSPGDGRRWRGAFRELWDSINAKRGYGWDVNPHVWVIEFRKL